MYINIVEKNRNFIVIEKPVGVASQSDLSDDKSVDEILKEEMGLTPYIVHRLDKPVGGLMVVALSQSVAAALSVQIQQKTFVKKYLTVVSGHFLDDQGTLTDYLKKMRTLNMSKVVDKNTPGSKLSTLSYQVIKRINDPKEGKLTLLEVTLETGRHHQIRVQMSGNRTPIWGDKKYHKRFRTKYTNPQIALYAYHLEFQDQTGQAVISELVPRNIYPFSLFYQ